MSICSLFNFLKIHNWFLLQDPLTYSISYNPPASLYFNIDSTSGLIRTATTLYQDEADRYVVCQLEVFFLKCQLWICFIMEWYKHFDKQYIIYMKLKLNTY